MRAAVLPLLALALPLGCVRGEEDLTIYPDGSGKLVLRVAIKKSVLKLAQEGARKNGGPELQNPLLALSDPAVLARIGEGVTAWKAERPGEDAEWLKAVVTAYFDDVNRVRIRSFDESVGPDGNPKVIFAATFRPGDAGGGTITIRTNISDGLKDVEAARAKARDDERAKAALESMKPLYAEMRGAIRVTVPGDVVSSRGFPVSDGRHLRFEFDGTRILGLLTDPENPEVRRFEEAVRGPSEATWSFASVPPEETRAFREEFEAAKALWSRVRGQPAAGPAPTPAAAPPKPKSLGADADQLTDDEVDRLFIEAQLKVAREQLDKGQKDKARATLQGVLKDFPKAKAAQEAKRMLDTLK